jgi:hypothetical protein
MLDTFRCRRSCPVCAWLSYTPCSRSVKRSEQIQICRCRTFFRNKNTWALLDCNRHIRCLSQAQQGPHNRRALAAEVGTSANQQCSKQVLCAERRSSLDRPQLDARDKVPLQERIDDEDGHHGQKDTRRSYRTFAEEQELLLHSLRHG